MTEQRPPMPAYPTDGATPQAPTGEPSKTLAIIALVCAVLGFCGITWIAAIVLSIIVLTRLKSGRAAGKGLAITALAICALWVLALVAFIIFAVATSADRDDDGNITKAGRINAADLRTGDCVTKEPKDDTVFLVDVAPCSDSHRYEVFGVVKLPAGDYPGEDEAIRLTEEACTDKFADYVGVSFDETSLNATTIYPTKQSWRDSRNSICLVIDGEKSTGSVKGSNR